MRILRCGTCGSDMRTADKIVAGNSIFIDWQCTRCLNKKTICEGIAKI